jgi:hypothetical protein
MRCAASHHIHLHAKDIIYGIQQGFAFSRRGSIRRKLSTSALSLLSASSKENRVRVEFSKNRFTMVISLSEGTFFTGLCKTSLNWFAVERIN